MHPLKMHRHTGVHLLTTLGTNLTRPTAKYSNQALKSSFCPLYHDTFGNENEVSDLPRHD